MYSSVSFLFVLEEAFLSFLDLHFFSLDRAVSQATFSSKEAAPTATISKQLKAPCQRLVDFLSTGSAQDCPR